MVTEYDEQFFDVIREGCRQSADVVVPLVLSMIPVNSVADVGCGEGWWGKAFEDAGCAVVGIDGDYAEPVIPHIPCDLETEDPSVAAELAVCLEVAEHLPWTRAASFVRALCEIAPTILFSAAIPGQGGTGHKNEQWPAYWVELFADNGYQCSGALRHQIWEDDRVENWYRQNLIVASREPQAYPELFDTPMAKVLPLVHPVLYDARRS
jgi:hypothetical protein